MTLLNFEPKITLWRGVNCLGQYMHWPLNKDTTWTSDSTTWVIRHESFHFHFLAWTWCLTVYNLKRPSHKRFLTMYVCVFFYILNVAWTTLIQIAFPPHMFCYIITTTQFLAFRVPVQWLLNICLKCYYSNIKMSCLLSNN